MNNAILQQMAVAPGNRDLQWIKTSLQAAIELELSTLPPYLCAMWSIRDSASPAYALIDSVVKQEMGHMGLVCNMLTAIGGTPAIAAGYVANIDYPGPLPGGVRPELTVFLSGLTKPYLHDVMMQIEFPENEIVFEALAFAGHSFSTIGVFYDALSHAFNNANPAVNIDPTRQLTSAFGVVPLVDLTAITNAIETIKTQGEGSIKSPADGGPHDEVAHYYRFAELYVGKEIANTASGGFAFSGVPVPFPDTVTVPRVAPGGYPGAPSNVATLLDAFNSLFSGLLDDLDAAWKNIDHAALNTAAVGKMLKLKNAAQNIMAMALPKPVEGFYGPTFQYIPLNKRTAPVPSGGAPVGAPAGGAGGPAGPAPTFSDVTKLLATLTGDDPNIGDSPHGAFWTKDYDTFMAITTDAWGVPGSLVVKSNPGQSILLKALSGPFGAGISQMPDTDLDADARHATPAELTLVSTWIANGCPK